MQILHCTRSIWLSNPEQIVVLDRGSAGALINACSLLDEDADYSMYNWVKLGTLAATVRLDDNEEELAAAASAAMRAKLEELEAKHEKEVTTIREAMSKLAAIGYRRG